MRLLAAGLLFAALTAQAQLIADRARLPPALLEKFESKGDEQRLNCRVTAFDPFLTFNFRFAAGYHYTVPLKQFSGPGHGWTILARLTPESGSGGPVYFANRLRLPEIPKTNSHLAGSYGYLLGEGRYHVEWMLLDFKGRVCRSQWRTEAKRKRGERTAQIGIPPNTVQSYGLTRPSVIAPPSGVPGPRLSVLLHAAPLDPARRRRWTYDKLPLISTMSAVVEQFPGYAVRLVIFSLEQQREIFRADPLTNETFETAARAIHSLELNTVDYRVLQNRGGHLQLLSSLIETELRGSEPSDAVVFLGPSSAYQQKLPEAMELGSGSDAPPVFFFRLKPPRARPEMPDSIQHAVKKVRGKAIQIFTPGDFADAISELKQQLSPKAR